MMLRFGVVLLVLMSSGWAWAQEEEPAPKPTRKLGDARWTTDPANVDERWEKAVEHRRFGQVDEAIALYETFLEESPREISVIISMGMAYWEKGDLKEAEKWLRKATVDMPKHIKAWQFLGQLLAHQGRWEEAEATFKKLVDLDWNRPDVLASGHFNLGKIALIKRRWKEADTHFFETGRSPGKGDRNSAKKGRRLIRGYRQSLLWPKVKTKHLNIWFSPSVAKRHDGAARKQWAAAREQAFVAMCGKVGIEFPEPWPVYCFDDDGDVYALLGLERVHDWKYSWWLVNTTWNMPVGHMLAHQLVARIGASRPSNKALVEGFCCYLDAGSEDPHAEAKALKSKNLLRGLVKLSIDQRGRMEDFRPFGASFVTWVIDSHGMKPWLKSWRSYGTVMLDRAYYRKTNLDFRWDAAFSEIFRRGLGQDLKTLNMKWREFLSR